MLACPSPPPSSTVLTERHGRRISLSKVTTVRRAHAILRIKDHSSVYQLRVHIPFASSPSLPLSFPFLDCHTFPTRSTVKKFRVQRLRLHHSHCRFLVCLCLFLGGSIPLPQLKFRPAVIPTPPFVPVPDSTLPAPSSLTLTDMQPKAVEKDTPASGHINRQSTNGHSNGYDMSSPSTIPQKFLTSPSDLGVVLVGFSGGQCKPGVDAAPTALVSAGILDQMRDELGYTLHGDESVRDYNQLRPQSDPDHRGMKNPRAVSAVTQGLAQQVYNQAREGRMVLTLGGDHSIAIGTIAGTAKAIRERYNGRKEIGVIWVDAHADINTPETSDSGNVHGMPVAFLTGLAKSEEKDIFGWLDDNQRISTTKLVYIGLRDVDRGEKKILRDNRIKAFSMHDIDRHGIGRVVEMALAHIGADTPIHLSFDVDALDPMWAPSTGTPVRGGLTLREGDYIAECVHETGQLVAMDLVEVNPSLEVAGASETVRAGVSLVRCALGDTLL